MPNAAKIDASQSVLRIVVGGTPRALARAMVRGLTSRGHQPSFFENTRELLTLLRREEFDVAAAYCASLHEAQQILAWFTARRPTTPLVVWSSEKIVSSLNLPLSDCISVHPWDHHSSEQRIEALEAMGPRRTFVGRNVEIELFDYIQVISNNGGSKLIRIETALGSGYLWLEQGQIVHAEYGDLEGEEAFYGMYAAGSGSFCEVGRIAAPKHSIENASTHLLMEASRREDESMLEPTRAASHPLDKRLFHDLTAFEAETWRVVDASPNVGPRPKKPSSVVASAGASAVDRSWAKKRKPNAKKKVVGTASPKPATSGARSPKPGPKREALATSPAFDLARARQQAQSEKGCRALIRECMSIGGVVAVVLCSRDGEVLAQDVSSRPQALSTTISLLRGYLQLSTALDDSSGRCIVLRRPDHPSMLVLDLGDTIIGLVFEAGSDPSAIKTSLFQGEPS